MLSAPAGSGKTTLTEMLVKEFPCVVESISFTTRQPRGKEVDGKHYFFISREEFQRKIIEGEFLEYAEIYGDYYGTSWKWVEEQRNQGKHVVPVIDTQGAAQVREKCLATFVFILPPSLEALRERLTKRKTESPEEIGKRLNWAKKEIEESKKYDYAIVNHDLETSYQVLKSIFIAEEHRRVKQEY